MEVKLGKYGDIKLKAPRSLATCMQFTALWAGDNDRAVLAQLCAGALGVCCDPLPIYAPSASAPLDYGFMVLEELLNAGIAPSKIYKLGSECLALMAGKLPSEDDVTEAENFIQAEQVS